MIVTDTQKPAYKQLISEGYGSLIECEDGEVFMTRLTITGDDAKDYKLETLKINTNGEIE